MTARVTIERILRDDDDDSGQTIREWKLEIESGFITLRSRHGDGFLLLRPADVDTFAADLQRAKVTAEGLAQDATT